MNVDHTCQMFSGRELRFRDLTLKIIEGMGSEQTDDLAAACVAGFIVAGDPRCWDGFSELSEETQFILNAAYGNWPGPAAPVVVPKDALIQ